MTRGKLGKDHGRDNAEGAAQHRANEKRRREEPAAKARAQAKRRRAYLQDDKKNEQLQAIDLFQRRVGRFIADAKDLRIPQRDQADRESSDSRANP